MPTDFRTPISLILRLGRGNRDDWNTFYEIYGPVIYRLCRARRLQHHDAQDIVGNVMKSLHRVIKKGLKLDHEKGRFRGYLARTVQRAILDFRRRKREAIDDPAGVESAASKSAAPDGDLAALERIERLRYCIASLRESRDVRRRDVEAFERYALEGEKAEKVAKFYGISASRLYGIRSEMLDRIRRMMAQLDLELGEV